MFPNFTVGVFNQKRWPKTGDADECWMLADLMAIHSVAPWLRLPNAEDYRNAAGNPDIQGQPDGGTIDDSAKAIRKLWARNSAGDPGFGSLIEDWHGRPWDEFLAKVKLGHPASLSVLSGSLPPAMQFGFGGTHRVAVFFDGDGLRLANPLARAHSRSRRISDDSLRKAMRDHPDPRVNAVEDGGPSTEVNAPSDGALSSGNSVTGEAARDSATSSPGRRRRRGPGP